MQHPGLDAVRANVIGNDCDLLADECFGDFLDRVNRVGVLRRQCRDRGRRVATKRRHRLDVGLDTRTAARIGSGDDQDTARYIPVMHWRKPP